MQPFVPHTLPPEDLDCSSLIGLIGEANRAIARYDGMLQSVVNPAILLSPMTTREAVLSSRIEGTQATLDEVLEHEAGRAYDEEKTKDIQEIVNYRKALMLGGETLRERPITLFLLQSLHKLLMETVRGQDKSPGEFRLKQNWLGRFGCSIEEATFVPPNPLQLRDHLEAWERYVSGSDVDVLVQTAVVHAQFEVIHPFEDGNGRIGRLLIPLFLFQKNVLGSPMFYLSEYLEQHRSEYYQCLTGISADNDWNSWVRFFLSAVAEQSKRNLLKVQRTLNLYDRMKHEISEITRSQHSIRLLDAIFDSPVFQSGNVIERTGLTKQTVMSLLRKLKEAGILSTLQESKGSRSAILAFTELVNITEGRGVL